MQTFTLSLRSPEKIILKNEKVQSVLTLTEGGPITLYAHHASLAGAILWSTLQIGQENGHQETYLLRRGTLFFNNAKNAAMILALSCEKMEEANLTSVEEYLAFVKEKLAKGEGLATIEIKYLKEEKLALTSQVETLKKTDKK